MNAEHLTESYFVCLARFLHAGPRGAVSAEVL